MFNHVEYIYAVYQEKSFTKAAQRLYISQPSLSATVSKVEKEIGYPIFDRSGREVTLTYIGQKYIRAAEQIMQIRNDLANEIDDLVKLRKGKVVLGCTAFIACHFLPPLLKAFGRKYPDVEVQLKVEPSTLLRERLEKGLVDIVIDNVLFKEPNYTYLPLLEEQILIGVPVELEVNKRLVGFVRRTAITKHCQRWICPFFGMNPSFCSKAATRCGRSPTVFLPRTACLPRWAASLTCCCRPSALPSTATASALCRIPF